MAEGDKNQGQGQQPPNTRSASAGDEEETEPTYSVEYLQTNARALLKASPSFTAGALAGVKGNKKNFTIDEAKTAIQEHKKRKVNLVHPESEDEA